MREGKQFETVECYTGLDSVRLKKDDIVLLECMSNLAANEMYAQGGAGEKTEEAVMAGIRRLLQDVRHLVVVTNEIFSDGMAYDESTVEYMGHLGNICLLYTSTAIILTLKTQRRRLVKSLWQVLSMMWG